MWSRRFLIVFFSAAATLAALPALGFERPFPENAKRGIMSPAHYPKIIINDKQRDLSPGARIWNQDNLIQVPASLRGGGFAVKYTEDNRGEIDRVWILTSDEAKNSSSR